MAQTPREMVLDTPRPGPEHALSPARRKWPPRSILHSNPYLVPLDNATGRHTLGSPVRTVIYSFGGPRVHTSL